MTADNTQQPRRKPSGSCSGSLEGTPRSAANQGHRYSRAALPILILALGIMLFATPGTAQANPVVLTIHGGGYIIGNAGNMAKTDAQFEALGYKAVSVDYTLSNIGAGWRDVKAVAESYGPRRHVFAIGTSAGGGYAAKLAERGMVDAAYGFSPLVDLTGEKWAAFGGVHFRCRTDHCQQRFSPVERRPLSPFRALVPLQDSIVDPADAIGWADRQMKVTAMTYDGDHCYPTAAGYISDVRDASDWFEREAPPRHAHQ